MQSRNNKQTSKQTKTKAEIMKTLFDVIDGIIESDYVAEYLAYPEAVMDYAEGMQMDLTEAQANSVIRVGNHWLEQQESGNGEWSRMRKEAKAALVCYMHTESGDVATVEMWKDDFDSMDVESWFGLPADECTDLHWLDDNKALIEVEWDTEEQEWIE